MNLKKRKPLSKKVLATMLCGVMAFGVGASATASASTLKMAGNEAGKYYPDFGTLAEAQTAAADVNLKIAEEGTVLLKNKNNLALPLSHGARVSLFGVSSDSLQGAGDNKDLGKALSEQGFKVNPMLTDYYGAVGTTNGTETTKFNGYIESSFGYYDDAAVVIISRSAGEYADVSYNTGEEEDEKGPDGEPYGWTHKASATEDGKKYKHFLQLTDSEEELIHYVKGKFGKVVVVLNSAHRLEMGNLEDDADISAILWMGHPGACGGQALARILDGTVNPSGKVVDTWWRDFTADPTWYNVMDNGQVGSKATQMVPGETDEDDPEVVTNSYMIDYEEDIYLGYKYTETVAYEQASNDPDWYAKNVVYPFGHGLSYTNYTYSNMSVKFDNEYSGTANSVSADLFSSEVGKPAQITTATASVTVTNTGAVAGKEAVQLYVTAPYTAGEVEKAYVSLIGFGKTDILKPGASQTLTISFDIMDMASYDYADLNKNNNKGYELDDGAYTIRAMGSSHGWADILSEDYQEVGFTLDKDALLKIDDFSGNAVGNLYSAENGLFNSLRGADGSRQVNSDATAKEVLLSRKNFTGAEAVLYPVAPTETDLTVSQDYVDAAKYWNNFKLDAGYKDNDTTEEWVTADDYPWMKDVEAAFAENGRATTWTQLAEDKEANDYVYQLKQMTGLDPYSNDVITDENSPFKGKTESQAWDEFMNSIKFSDLKAIVYDIFPTTVTPYGWYPNRGSDGTNNLSSTYQWNDQVLQAATWNVELANERGIAIGNMALLKNVTEFWGPANEVHRTPFTGRTSEKFSEDALLCGYMGASVIGGLQSKGINCMAKHFGLNDQETYRTANQTFNWVSEQALREIYFRPYKRILQQGGATGVMLSYGRIGSMCTATNYNFITGMIRNEWGFFGHVGTDNNAMTTSTLRNDLEIRAGANGSCKEQVSGEWDATARDGKGSVKITPEGETAYISDAQYYLLRVGAMGMLYTASKTAENNNGVDMSKLPETVEVTILANFGVEETVMAFDPADYGAEAISYSLASALPEGLSFERGVISGNTSQTGVFNINVNVLGDGWISQTVKLKLTVAESPVNLTDMTLELDEDYEIPVNFAFAMTMPAADGGLGFMSREILSVTGLPDGLEYQTVK